MDTETQEKASRHVWEFVQTLAGPVIYLGFFGLTYLASSFACALSRDDTPSLSDAQSALCLAVMGLTITSLALIAWHMATFVPLLTERREDPEGSFMGRVSFALALLSAVAVLWTAFPAAVLPLAC
jgi:hypothetical protein